MSTPRIRRAATWACLACLGALATSGCGSATAPAGPSAPVAPSGPLMRAAAASIDPLPSWRAGSAKEAILAFVQATTTPGTPQFVPIEERIVAFDGDGTLWVEQPAPTQLAFAIDRVKALQEQHPEWRGQRPFSAILSDDRALLDILTVSDVQTIVAATHAGMRTEAFRSIVDQWLATASHPRFHRRYVDLVYLPMLELIAYLRANDFRTYIVTGSGQEFVRSLAGMVYRIPPEQVIGTAGKLRFEYDTDGSPMLIKEPHVLFIDDHEGKAAAIELMIGRRPIGAVGNSTGDRQMLEWARSRGGGQLKILIHHDDAEREYAYGPETTIGRFTDELLAEAQAHTWIVVSVRDDWAQVFPPERR